MSVIYGVEGSATYAVTLDSLDEMMSLFKDNTTNDISAQDTRNALLTLSVNSGSGGGSFSYTQTAPLTQRSTKSVGGIPEGITFSNVPLQVLFDRMFFPSVPTGFSIAVSPSSLQLGGPSTTSVQVSLTRNTPTINSAQVSGGPGNSVKFSTFPSIPTATGQLLSTSYSGVNVTQDVATTYILTINDGQSRSTDATVNWYFPRWVGTVNLNNLSLGGKPANPNLDTTTLNLSQKQQILDLLSGPLNDWSPVWNGQPNFCEFFEFSGPVSRVKDIQPVVAAGSHIVYIFVDSDYGGDGTPSGYRFGADEAAAGIAFPEAVQIVLGENSATQNKIKVKNRYDVEYDCKIWISKFKLTGKLTILIS